MRFAHWHAPIPALIEATILRNDIYDRHLTVWGNGRITRLGDAVHPMTPNMGQRAGQAIEDAVILGQAIAQATDTSTALRTNANNAPAPSPYDHAV